MSVTEIIPTPEDIRRRLSEHYRQARLLRSLLRLSSKAREQRDGIPAVSKREGSTHAR